MFPRTSIGFARDRDDRVCKITQVHTLLVLLNSIKDYAVHVRQVYRVSLLVPQ